MGSGSKIKFGYVPFIALGVSAARLPFAFTLHFNFICFYLTLGFGKGYDQ